MMEIPEDYKTFAALLELAPPGTIYALINKYMPGGWLDNTLRHPTMGVSMYILDLEEWSQSLTKEFHRTYMEMQRCPPPSLIRLPLRLPKIHRLDLSSNYSDE